MFEGYEGLFFCPNLHVQVCIERQTLGEGPTLEETFNFRKSLEGVCVLRRRVPSVNAA